MGKKIVIFVIFTIVSVLFITNPSVAKETPYYTIQLANTKNLNEAKTIFEKVKHLESSRVDKANTRYKVRVGLFKTAEKARKFLKNHPEIKKISPTAYITLNYYDPQRTILKGSLWKEEKDKEKKTKTETISKKGKEPSKAKDKISSSAVSDKTSSTKKQKTSPTNVAPSPKEHEKNNYTGIKIEEPILKVAGIIITGILLFTLFIGIRLIVKKNEQPDDDFKLPDKELLEEKPEKGFFNKLKELYFTVLKRLPIKTSQKIIEYHYRKSGDFRSLILLKLQEQDFNFILRETPPYLLRNSDDILVWKIYIEVLGQLGIYDEAANACEKLAEILKKNARPEAAENYIKKAQEYRRKALKLAENL